MQKIFARFRMYNLKIKPQKCHIGAASISYLGYEISAGKGIKPGLAKTLVIKTSRNPDPSKKFVLS